MPGIGWECEKGCGQTLLEDQFFNWEPTCICEAKGSRALADHSKECLDKDWKDKHNKLYPFIKEHVKNCSILRSRYPNYSLCPNCFTAYSEPFACPDCGEWAEKVIDDNNPSEREREREQKERLTWRTEKTRPVWQM